jgi:hypothetical protein
MARSDLHWVSTEIPLSNTAHRSENRGRDRRKRAQTRQPSRGPRLCCPHCGNDSIDLRPAGGQPYRYPTKQEAEHMRRLCYPDQVREERLGGDPVTRVVEEDC